MTLPHLIDVGEHHYPRVSHRSLVGRMGTFPPIGGGGKELWGSKNKWVTGSLNMGDGVLPTPCAQIGK